MSSISNPPNNGYFARQRRLANQEAEAMRDLQRLNESQPKHQPAYTNKGVDGKKVAPMPGVIYYEEPGPVRKLLEKLKIIKPDSKRIRPTQRGTRGFI